MGTDRRGGGAATTDGSLAVRFVASISRTAREPGRINAATPNCRLLLDPHSGHGAAAGTSAIEKARSKPPQARQWNQ